MIMTYDEYIKNPMGKLNSVYSQRGMYKDLYTQKFDAIIAREAGKIKHYLFRDSSKRYIALIKIPSEVVPSFYYDVIIEWTTTDVAVESESSLNNYRVKFFSNDPAFVFTFAHSFYKNDMFFKDLEPKMSKMAIEKRAVVKNPKDLIGYVKSIYFAYLFIKLRGIDKKAVWIASQKYSKQILTDMVEHADKKVEERQIKGEEIEKKERKSKTVGKKKVPGIGSNIVPTTKKVVVSNKIKSTKTTKTTGYIKTTKRK